MKKIKTIECVHRSDEAFTLVINGHDIVSVNHDQHGWDGMGVATDVAERLSDLFDVPITERLYEGDEDD